MQPMRKFTFDELFDFDQQAKAEAEAAKAEPEARFTEADLQMARADGVEQGRAAARAEFEQSQALHTAQYAERIADGIAALGKSEMERSQTFRATSIDVAMTALRKILPELMRKCGQAEIEAALGDVIAQQLDEPRIVVRVADAALDPLIAHIGELTQKRGYSGKAVVIAEPELGPSDLRVEWADGGAERLADRTIADIAAALTRLAHAVPAGDSSTSSL